MKKYLILLFAFLTTQLVSAQCESWHGASNMDELETSHVIYRHALTTGKWSVALEHWGKVFNDAPLGYGTKDNQFWDGISLYKHQLSQTKDPAKRTELTNKIIGLYDQLAYCVENNSLPCKGEDCKEKTIDYVYGKKKYFLNQQTDPAQLKSIIVE